MCRIKAIKNSTTAVAETICEGSNGIECKLEDSQLDCIGNGHS